MNECHLGGFRKPDYTLFFQSADIQSWAKPGPEVLCPEPFVKLGRPAKLSRYMVMGPKA